MKLNDVINNPTNFFETPEKLMESEAFSKADKIQIFQKWEQDAHQLVVASEEGMDGGESAMLHKIKTMLDSLEAESDGDPSPSK
tara:strand:+ start:1702 stop:1953 length:252 start_codon:yes stop_codon:yes gene_type:complete